MNPLILCLISMLGSEKFQERNFAGDELSKVLPIEVLFVEPVNFEAKLRLTKLQNIKKSQLIENWLNQKEPLPWMHSTVSPLTFSTVGDKIEIMWYPSYRRATRRYLSNILYERFDFLEAQVIVDRLQDLEEEWLEEELRVRRRYGK